MERDYDATLVRCAGNIAAGILGRPEISLERVDPNWVEEYSFKLAKGLVKRARILKVGQLEFQKGK